LITALAFYKNKENSLNTIGILVRKSCQRFISQTVRLNTIEYCVFLPSNINYWWKSPSV